MQDGEDRVGVDGTVDVWEALVAPRAAGMRGPLEADGAPQFLGIDFEEHEVAAATIEGVGYTRDLLGGRAVNEAFVVERRSAVGAGGSRPLGLDRDVVD